MLIRRCTWHRLYRGYPKIMGFRAGQGLRPYFTDGLCRRCAQRVEQEWFGDPLPPSRVQTLLATPVSRRGVAAAAGVAALMFLVAPGHRVGVTPVASAPTLAHAAAPVFIHVASAEASNEPVPPPIVTRAPSVLTRLLVATVEPTPPAPAEPPRIPAPRIPAPGVEVPPVVWLEPVLPPPPVPRVPAPAVSHSGPRLESRGIEAP
jgi:hypothetical protein